MNWISLLISLVIFSVAIYFIVKIHKRQYAKLENKKKLRITCLVLLYIASVNYGVGVVGNIISLANGSNNSSAYETIQDNTTESVYRGSRGTEVIICDNGIAYIDGKRGSWTDSYVRLGSNSHEFIKIRQNGMISEGGIFEGKFYYGRNAEMAIKENYPNGESLTKTRR